MQRTLYMALLSLFITVCGCSSGNDNNIILDTAGKHPADWVSAHRVAALGTATTCYECHGGDLKGGVSKVSCFSAQLNGQFCHAGGPPAQSHPNGWRDPGLHGASAKSQPGLTSGFANCQACHGADFSGGIVGVSCFVGSRATGSCHTRSGLPVNAPHAALPWRTYPFPTHTETVDDAAGSNAAVCALCHTAGRNLTTPILSTYAAGKPGCFNSTLCHGSLANPHPVGWVKPNLHCIAARGNLNSCQQCHADKPTGGPGSNPRFNVPIGRLVNGCEDCHAPYAAHPRVMQIPVVFGTLTTFTPLGTPWYLHCKASPSGFDTCNRCHGAALDGVGAVAGATACTFCHRNALPTTLKNCTSCHAAPPNGTAYPNLASAHAVHNNGTLSPKFTCDDCHLGLGSVTLDHFNRAKARTTGVQAGAVNFGAFAATGGLTPAYNATNKQCTNTYCHGVTLSGGANKLPLWNQTNYLTAAGCGTCHGFPPTAISPHTVSMLPTQCSGCHPHVNAAGTGFTDPAKHIDGAVDATSGGGAAHQFPYPGSVHKSAAGSSPFSACLACHTNSSANRGTYPVTAGNPPDCQGCHVKASPGNSCGSCHGTAANGGRPSGSAFPDVAGQHSNNHGSFACSTCHGANGTGQSSHGPSNGTAHGDANVDIQFTEPGNTIIFTRNVPGNGHGTCSGSCHGQNHTNDTW